MKNFFLFLLSASLLAGCGKSSYRKTPGGMPYKIFKGKGKEQIVAGDVVKLNLAYRVNDSVYFSSFGKIPAYIKVNPQAQPYDISEVWTQVHIGDSLIATQMMDTFIRRSPDLINKFKKGDRIITNVKVLGVFKSDSLATVDEENEKKVLLASEIEYLGKYLADKKINTQKSPSGIFVQIIEPGTGNQPDSGKYVSVNYTGTTLDGKKFDSNVDTSFHHVGPISFTIGTREMIAGFDEGVKFLKPGGTAKLYIPSMLGYGARPNPASGIKPFEHLVFDLTLLDIKDKAPAQKPFMEPK